MKWCQFEGDGRPTVDVHRLAVMRRSVGGSPDVQTWTKRSTEAVFFRIVLNSNLSHSVSLLQRCKSVIDRLVSQPSSVRQHVDIASFLSLFFFFFFIVHTLVEGFPDVVASPLLTQKLEQTDVA